MSSSFPSLFGLSLRRQVRLGVTIQVLGMISSWAQETATNADSTAEATQPETTERRIFIQEYRVEGVKHLPPLEVETAVYPHLGPRRTAADVENARAALEKAYRDKGYQTVTVEVPPQEPKRGIVKLRVVENTVGRLRVRGSRYFSIAQIKKAIPSLAEGTVVDFNQVTKELVALNQLPDRQITPSLKPGVEPGTVDIDLTVKDKFPLHGNVELNNRYSADTTELRVSGGINYNNLWQRGHAIGASFQVAPERPEDAKVFSAYYIARFANWDRFSLMLTGTKQDSDVSTLGGAAVVGRGEIFGLRGMFNLPSDSGFYHSLSVGLDYKHFKENVIIGTDEVASPITYYPISASYSAGWMGDKRFTELNASLTWHLRDTGSDEAQFAAKRFKTDDGFIFFRGDVSHTQDLPWGAQIFGKLQGQAASGPLLNSEQYAGGGLSTVRGYLESTVLGDNGWFGTVEVRTPSLLGFMNPKPAEAELANVDPANEWRFYGFVDGGRLTLHEPLPDQQQSFKLLSVGVGTRFKLLNHLNGSVDIAWPLEAQGTTEVNDPFLTFRVWADF
jgi:hemolysin activation/secretion protein